MAEFYVSFEWNEIRFIGFVVAPDRPTQLDFANYEELRGAMEALGNLWEMTFEMPHPDELACRGLEVWQKQLARAIEQIPVDPIPGRRRGLLE
ncbi:MAG: hypothetical protein AB7O59_20615 [Pirellulales bacterium]